MQARSIVFVSTMEGVPWGGSEELWARAAAILAERGITVIASVHGWPELHPRLIELSRKGVDVRPRLYISKKRTLSSILRRLITRRVPRVSLESEVEKAFHRISPDLVVLSDGGPYPPVELVELCAKKQWPFVTVGQMNLEGYWPIDQTAARYRNALQRALRCFFVSKANRTLAERQLGCELGNAEIVQNPVNVQVSGPLLWPASGLSHELRLACVGRLHPPSKGQDILLEALSTPQWTARNWRLTLYGEGPNRDSLERLVKRLGLVDRVDLGGHVSPERIWQLNHVLVLASRYEGLPLVIVEAMLCGRPVVATDVAGNAEVVKDGVSGFIAEAPTSRSFSQALERMWDRRASLEEMGRAAASSIREFLTGDPSTVFAAKIEQLAKLQKPRVAE